MSDIEWTLKSARHQIDDALQLLEKAPEKTAIIDLINACEKIDRHYEEECKAVDEAYDEEEGFHYEHGFNMEYYIESDWWHEISVALRKLKNIK